MPPIIASLLTAAFVIYLFRRDTTEKSSVSAALWIPTIWLLLLTTRAISSWFSIFGFSIGGRSLEEGSIVDALVYLTLIVAGLRVLIQRHISLASVIRNNRWLTIYLLYCFLAVAWSDYPFVAFKRWFKDLGHPIMVLIILTEADITESLTRLLKRCAYVVLPISILFIKYYPEWGRGFSRWNGVGFYTGITESKNSLGWDCLILIFFLAWHIVMTLRMPKGISRRNEIVLAVTLLCMAVWLFSIADSKTPLLALCIALALLIATAYGWVNKRKIGAYVLCGGLSIIVLDATFDIYNATLQFLGRDPSLTERAPLWTELRKWGDENPILGTGFESFWLGARREAIWDTMRWEPNNSHNGYLETYLNIGLLGLVLLSSVLVTTYFKARAALLRDNTFGQFRLPFFFAILAYNWTEASLHGLHPVYFMLFVIGMDYPRPTVAHSGAVFAAAGRAPVAVGI